MLVQIGFGIVFECVAVFALFQCRPRHEGVAKRCKRGEGGGQGVHALGMDVAAAEDPEPVAGVVESAALIRPQPAVTAATVAVKSKVPVLRYETAALAIAARMVTIPSMVVFMCFSAWFSLWVSE